MKRQHIMAISLPDRLAATAFAEEPRPHENIPCVGAPGVWRACTHGGTGAEEAVEIEIIAAVIHQDERHAVDQPGALGDVERAGSNVRCETINGKRARNSAKTVKIQLHARYLNGAPSAQLLCLECEGFPSRSPARRVAGVQDFACTP